jgi:5'-3' exonuclease
MIILDLNQVMISNLMVQIGNHTNAAVEENMFRHMILNTIRSLNIKFRDEYGEFVITADGGNCWRKKCFPYYKANRKKGQETSEINWPSIFECMNKIRTELKEYFPYRVIHLNECEADDAIACLVNTFHKTDNILIVSGDKDFNQLQYDSVKQYDPTRKKFISCAAPDEYLEEHILRGDKGDGIPNILSDADTFVVGKRQKTLTQRKIDELKHLGLAGKFDHPLYRNYIRNSILIDLSRTPDELKQNIINSYEEQSNKNGSKLMNYFMTNRLKNLMEHMGDFV